MKIKMTLTNEEIQAINNTVLETTKDLSELDMCEEKSELLRDGDVIDTGAIRIEMDRGNVNFYIESKFVFWCLKFATKVTKLCKAVYEMFSGLFDEVTDGYFKDKTIRYNKHDTSNLTDEYKVKILESFTKLKEMVDEAKDDLYRIEVRGEIDLQLEKMQNFMTSTDGAEWGAAIDLITQTRHELLLNCENPNLGLRILTTIDMFLLSHKN